MTSYINLPTCILCKNEFDTNRKLPCTQSCQHTICMECISSQTKETIVCPVDEKIFKLTKIVNKPLLKLIDPEAPTTESCCSSSIDEEVIEDYLISFAKLLKANSSPNAKDILSKQLQRSLVHLIECTFYHEDGRLEFVHRISSVFNRLLLELFQAHCEIEVEENSFLFGMLRCGYLISEPSLTNSIISLLIKLYEAADQYFDAWFERETLIKYLMEELGDHIRPVRGVVGNKKQVEMVVETLYMSHCFHMSERLVPLINGTRDPSRLRLKEELRKGTDIRQRHDIEIVKMARKGFFTCLPPESWAFILYKSFDPDNIKRMQSILDEHQTPVKVSELERMTEKMGDQYGIRKHKAGLQRIQDTINRIVNDQSSAIDLRVVGDLMKNLDQVKRLFTYRQKPYWLKISSYHRKLEIGF